MISYKKAFAIMNGFVIGLPIGMYLSRSVRKYASFDGVFDLSNIDNMHCKIISDDTRKIIYVKNYGKLVKD